MVQSHQLEYTHNRLPTLVPDQPKNKNRKLLVTRQGQKKKNYEESFSSRERLQKMQGIDGPDDMMLKVM